MRIAFAGTPAFAAVSLAALLDAGHDVALVLAQPDRPAGRGMKLVAGPLKSLALQHGLAVHQPTSLKTDEAREPLRQAGVEAMVVAAYGLILPPAVLALPRFGCLNVHASLLPRWRGAAPIARAILAGDRETGVSIMHMEAGLDSGPVLLSRALPIAAEDTSATLEAKLAELGAALIVEALPGVQAGRLKPIPQPSDGVTYADKLRKEEARIDWTRPAEAIERQVRAFDPFPVASTTWRGAPLKLWRAVARPLAIAVRPGVVVKADAAGILVACGDGALLLNEVQRAGGRRLDSARFLAGSRIEAGDVLGEDASHGA